MKFRTIFIIFNIILVLSFIFIFLAPLLLFNIGESLRFWLQNWPFILFFVLILFVFNFYFIKNWKVFSLLEHEDWAKLCDVLHEQMYIKNNLSKRTVRLYINAALLANKVGDIKALEEHCSNGKRNILERDLLYFVVARVLVNETDAALSLIDQYDRAKSGEYKDWLGFYKGFLLVMKRDYAAAFSPLHDCLSYNDPIILLLASYLLDNLCVPALTNGADQSREHSLLLEIRQKLQSRFSPKRWSAETERAKNEVPVVILSKLIDEAGAWLYKQA